MKVAIAILFSVLTVKAMPVREALGQIESGDNDKAHGKAGEVSRYQIRPTLWAIYSKSKNYTDPNEAWEVASQILGVRIYAFAKANNRPPTPFEIYVLWNAPAQIARPSRVVSERATRFENLINSNKH
jgi:hypothetical protein